MSSPSAFADRLYVEEVTRARRMEPGEKLLEGPRLFDRACRLMAEGVRHQYPGFDEAAVAALVSARLARLRAIEQA